MVSKVEAVGLGRTQSPECRLGSLDEALPSFSIFPSGRVRIKQRAHGFPHRSDQRARQSLETVYAALQVFEILKKRVQGRYQAVDIFHPGIYGLPLVIAEFDERIAARDQPTRSLCI